MRTNQVRAWVGLLSGSAALWGATWSCNPHFNTCEDRLDCVDGNPNASGGAGGAASGGSGNGSGGQAETCADLDCVGLRPHCDEEALKCVECLETEHCTKATASVCDEGECVSCSTNEDCEHVEGKGICDDGECVGCLSENDCNGNVCAPQTKTCTDTVFRSRAVCQECAHDADCREGQYCVEMSYPSPAPGVVGSFCLWSKDAPTGPAGACNIDIQPYSAERTVTSVDGVEGVAVCSLASTTCPALNQFRTEVLGCVDATPTSNAACGAPGFNDGRCRQEVSAWKCTYPCAGPEDCKPGFSCSVDGICSFL